MRLKTVKAILTSAMIDDGEYKTEVNINNQCDTYIVKEIKTIKGVLNVTLEDKYNNIEVIKITEINDEAVKLNTFGEDRIKSIMVI